MTTNTSYPLNLKFPLVLHSMLEDAKVMGFEDIVSWLPNSNMFKIHNSEKFISQQRAKTSPRFIASVKTGSIGKLQIPER
jgi:hypothetical protein